MRKGNSFCRPRFLFASMMMLFCLLLTSCGATHEDTSHKPINPEVKGERDNSIVCLIPTAGGKIVYQNDGAIIDCSHMEKGYICAKYDGTDERIKLQITDPTDVVYTYNLTPNLGRYQFFPLSYGDGDYTVAVYKNVKDTKYSALISADIEVKAEDPFLPFLYANQYVNFTSTSKAVQLAKEIVAPANDDLEAISCVYDYVREHISYDEEKAQTVESNYLPDIDEVLESGKGICFDYASLMTAMLRSQRIPCRLEIGYAGTAYHAWISTYVEDIGWVNGIIEFDGTDWSLMDPTLAANESTKELRSFIGNGDNYKTKYVY